MMLAGNFAQAVAEGREEVLVGGQDLAGRREFNGRLDAGDGFEFAGIFGGLQLRCRDVGRKLDDL